MAVEHRCPKRGENKLNIWCNTQRQARKKGLLSEERTRLLDSIGFWWEQDLTRSGRRTGSRCLLTTENMNTGLKARRVGWERGVIRNEDPVNRSAIACSHQTNGCRRFYLDSR